MWSALKHPYLSTIKIGYHMMAERDKLVLNPTHLSLLKEKKKKITMHFINVKHGNGEGRLALK